MALKDIPIRLLNKALQSAQRDGDEKKAADIKAELNRRRQPRATPK